ncbi:MAG: hypothetical protein ACRC1M_05265 [Methanobacteriaceae archaeon]
MPKFGKLLGGLLLVAIGGFLLYKNSQTPLETIFVILAILVLLGGIYLVIRGFNYSSNLIEVPKNEIANTVGSKVKSANIGTTIGTNMGNRGVTTNNKLSANSNLKPSSLKSNNNSKRNNNKKNRNNRNMDKKGMNNSSMGNNSKKINLNGSKGLNNNISSLNKDNSEDNSVNSSYDNYNNYNSLNKHRLVKPKEEKPKSKIDILKKSFSSSSDDEVKEFTFQPNYQKPNLVTRKPKKKEVPSHSLEDLLSAESVNKNPKKSETENNIFDNISKYRSNQKKSDEFKEPKEPNGPKGPKELSELNLIKPKIKEFNTDNDSVGINNKNNDNVNDIANDIANNNGNNTNNNINNINDNVNDNTMDNTNNVNINNNISEDIAKYVYGDDEYNVNNRNNAISNVNTINNDNIGINNNYSRPKLNKNPEGSYIGSSNSNISLNDGESSNAAENNVDVNAPVEDSVVDNNVNNDYNEDIDKEFYVVCENKILSSNEAVEKLILRAKNEIILEIPSLKGLSPDILANLSNASRIIIGQFDIKDMGYVILLSSLIEQNTEIRTLDFVDSINMVVDDKYGLIISGANNSSGGESDTGDDIGPSMGVGAVYNDSESISSIKNMFNKSWEIATEIKI